jgi:signal transduction histidine kinase
MEEGQAGRLRPDLEHDLKNQLGIIIGFVELLIEETPATDQRQQDLLEIRRAARACIDVIDRSHK